MDSSDILNKVHKRMLANLQGREGADSVAVERVKGIMTKDQVLRKAVADLYVNLIELNDRPLAIEVLAEHIAILVEMLNEFKKSPD